MSDRASQFTDTKCTYFLCPDASCSLFTKPDCRVPCENECPHASRMQKAIVCSSCKTLIRLPADHHPFYRVECKCGAQLFTRMSSRYRRVNV